MLNHAQPRQDVVDACGKLIRAGVMSASGHGNFSARVGPQRMLLTPAGMSTPPHADEIALVGLDGVVEEGQIAASVAEIVGMHAVIYQSRPDIGAVVHTHSPAVTAFALAHEPLPCRYEALLRHGQVDAVPVVPWAPRGSPASLEGIAAALAAAPSTLVVLLANHGLLAFGSTPAAAANVVVAAEEAAAAELAALALGGAQAFPAGAADNVAQSMARARKAQGAGG